MRDDRMDSLDSPNNAYGGLDPRSITAKHTIHLKHAKHDAPARVIPAFE